MGPVRVVVIDVVDDKLVELAAVPDDGAVEELASQGADPAFGERVRHGGAHRCGEDLHTFGSEDLVEGVDELAGAVAHERLGVGELVAVTEQQVPRRLGGPDAGGVVRDPCEVHAPGPDVDEEQQVEPAQRDGFDGGEVAGDGGLGAEQPKRRQEATSAEGVAAGLLRSAHQAYNSNPLSRRMSGLPMGVRPCVQHGTGGHLMGCAAVAALRYQPSVSQAPRDFTNSGIHYLARYARRGQLVQPTPF